MTEKRIMQIPWFCIASLRSHIRRKCKCKCKRSSHVHCNRKGSKTRRRSSSPLSKMVDEKEPVSFFTLRLRFPGSHV